MALVGLLVDKYYDFTTDDKVLGGLSNKEMEQILLVMDALPQMEAEEELLNLYEQDPDVKLWLSKFAEDLSSEEVSQENSEEMGIHEWILEEAEIEGTEAQNLADKSAVGKVLLRILFRKVARRYLRWFGILKKSQADISEQLMSTYSDVDLFISPMMDMDEWFSKAADNSLDDRLANMVDLMVNHRGKLHAMVPFDPRRAIKEGENLALERVRTAVMERGFVGVKIYPPMGFRPSGNVETHPSLESPEKYDKVLSMLFSFCQEHDVPITAHCTPHGAQSNSSENSGLNSNPQYWIATLNEFNQLRVNLGHFGGIDQMLSEETDSWTLTIAGMMNDYPNLYADCGHHGITKKKRVKAVVRSLKRLYADHGIQDRYLYGSDWHMIVRQGKEEGFGDTYASILNRLDLSNPGETKRKFFGENALRFLALDKGSKGRERIIAFYAKHEIETPDWVTMTEA